MRIFVLNIEVCYTKNSYFKAKRKPTVGKTAGNTTSNIDMSSLEVYHFFSEIANKILQKL